MSPERLHLRVAYYIRGRLCVEVQATFHTPEARTIAMTIVQGEGGGNCAPRWS